MLWSELPGVRVRRVPDILKRVNSALDVVLPQWVMKIILILFLLKMIDWKSVSWGLWDFSKLHKLLSKYQETPDKQYVLTFFPCLSESEIHFLSSQLTSYSSHFLAYPESTFYPDFRDRNKQRPDVEQAGHLFSACYSREVCHHCCVGQRLKGRQRSGKASWSKGEIRVSSDGRLLAWAGWRPASSQQSVLGDRLGVHI